MQGLIDGLDLSDKDEFEEHSIYSFNKPNVTTAERTGQYYLNEQNELTHLAIINFKKSDIDSIPNHKSLTHLMLRSNNTINDFDIFKNLKNLKNLENLEFDSFSITKIPQSILSIENLKSLKITSSHISKIPNDIDKLNNLAILDLSKNKIFELPDSLFNLNKLTVLSLENNIITEIPEDLKNLKNLKNLTLSDNKISKITKNISYLKKITWLALNGNSISEISSDLLKLPEIKYLILDDNDITSIPENINNLKKLEFLSINNNNIKSIPKSFFDLKLLNFLDLGKNSILKIPMEISNLNSLDSLYLHCNKIKDLPSSFSELKSLQYLVLSGNPISKYLREIESELNPKELITYLLSLQKEGTKPLNEAKILVVGDERVGKTSVINRIIGNPHNPNQVSTQGIDIQNHVLSNNIKANIWDFAGQEITHQTHQFFLSSRSLYLYVLDSQKEDNDSGIYHWLSVIKANGGNSPIIIVINKRDLNTSYKFDLNRYSKDFNIVDVIYLSSLDNKNINNEVLQCINQNINCLTKSIEKNIENLENINFPLPKSWTSVKKKLEEFSKRDIDYVESNEYEKLCERFEIFNTILQNTLLTILNQIGTIVTYKNNSRLNVMQIINPLWVTNGVYKIIRSPLINETAILEQSKFKDIFKHDTKYKPRQYTWLTDLLNQFELSIQIEKNTILIPSRLNQNQPVFELNDYQKGLNFRYTYHNILKKSVISQLIVRMKNYISNSEDKYWQRGVFLQHGDATAVVISDEEKKTINISLDVSSRSATELLTIIRHTLRDINGINLEVDEEIPLIVDNNIVGFEDYYFLIDAENNGQTTLPLKINEPNSSRSKSKTFNLIDLLNGYRIKEDTKFDYDKLTKDLIEISIQETDRRQTIYNESEDETNDRFQTALFNRKYIVNDQSRGGESESSKRAGERDLVIKNNQTFITESVIEAFILKSLTKNVIDNHVQKLCTKYDTSGNEKNYLLIYSKSKNFHSLWEKYKNHFSEFTDTEKLFSNKTNVKVGISKNEETTIFHIFINFFST